MPKLNPPPPASKRRDIQSCTLPDMRHFPDPMYSRLRSDTTRAQDCTSNNARAATIVEDNRHYTTNQNLKQSKVWSTEMRRACGGATEMRRKCDGDAEARRRCDGSATEVRRRCRGAAEARQRYDGSATETKRPTKPHQNENKTKATHPMQANS